MPPCWRAGEAGRDGGIAFGGKKAEVGTHILFPASKEGPAMHPDQHWPALEGGSPGGRKRSSLSCGPRSWARSGWTRMPGGWCISGAAAARLASIATIVRRARVAGQDETRARRSVAVKATSARTQASRAGPAHGTTLLRPSHASSGYVARPAASAIQAARSAGSMVSAGGRGESGVRRAGRGVPLPTGRRQVPPRARYP